MNPKMRMKNSMLAQHNVAERQPPQREAQEFDRVDIRILER
jgi:hypothetical protein